MTSQDLIQLVPELQNPDMPRWQLEVWDNPKDSSNFNSQDWKRLARCVEANYHAFTGFVILHGTDTMAYTASALSFMLGPKLSKPVILTGAQVSVHQSGTDAKQNLIEALSFAGKSVIPEVAICFNHCLYRGNRATKVDCESMAAFDSPNCPPLATLDTSVPFAIHMSSCVPLKVDTNMVTDVVSVLFMTPIFDPRMLKAAVQNDDAKSTKGLILVLYGTGNGPVGNSDFLDMLGEAQRNNVAVVITSQCSRGSVDMSVYATGAEMQRLGLIDGRDMTLESCVTKLAYLLGKNSPNLKNEMESNLCGELTVRGNI
jgi:L-asparaginase